MDLARVYGSEFIKKKALEFLHRTFITRATILNSDISFALF